MKTSQRFPHPTHPYCRQTDLHNTQDSQTPTQSQRRFRSYNTRQRKPWLPRSDSLSCNLCHHLSNCFHRTRLSWTTPSHPCRQNAANTSAIIRCHTEDTRQWREFKNVSTALKNQLLSTVEDIYVRALRDRHVGYMNQSIHNLLTHLFENYGNITQLELEDNDTKMRALWDPNSPFDCLVQQLEDGQDYADDAGQPYTANQLLRILYTLVFKTGLYFEDCKAWNAKPNNDKTWTTFKTHFHHAQRLLRDQLCTTKQAGFTSNVAIHHHPNETQPPPEYREALVNLATSAAKDHELLTTLATTVAIINDHIQHLNKPPVASVHNSETTNSTALSSITSSVTDLQQQSADLKRENDQLRNKQTR